MSLNKEVQGYYVSDQATTSTDYQQVNTNLVSTIVYGYIYVNSDGSLTKISSYNPKDIVTWFHTHGVKVTLQIVNSSSNFGSSTAIDTAVNNLLNEAQNQSGYTFDGIDTDFENFNGTNLLNFQTKLANTFWSNTPKWTGVSKYHMTMPVTIDSTVSNYNLNSMQNYVDYIMVMAYDWYGDWNTCAGPNAPMMLDSNGGCYGINFGIINRIHYIESLMNKNKLLLGVPWYGYLYPTINNIRYALISGGKTVSSINYKDYVNEYTNPVFDLIWKTPWYTYQDGTGQWWQAHFDNLQSLGIKYDFVNSEGLPGIGIFSLLYGTGRTDLWDLITSKFSVASLSVSLSINPTTIAMGQSVTFSATVTGGTIPYSYLWQNLPVPCSGTTNIITCTPTFTGSYNVSITVQDATGVTASANGILIINAIQNVILNPGFETISPINPSLPANWTKYKTGSIISNPYIYPVTPGNPYGTSRTCISTNFPTKNRGNASWTQKIKMNPGKIYTLSGYMKANNIVASSTYGAKVGVDWFSGVTYISSTTTQTVTGTKDWAQYSGQVTVPLDADNANIWLMLSNCSGQVWFDDVFLG